MNYPVEFKVPCENVNDLTAKIVAWKVGSGVTVREGDTVAELETSKATFPVFAPVGGVIEYRHALHAEVPVGEILFRILAEGSQVSPAPEVAPAPPPSAAAAPVAAVGTSTFTQRAQDLMAELGLSASLFAGLSFVRESDVRKKHAELRAAGPAAAAVTPAPVPLPPAPAAPLAPAPGLPPVDPEEGELIPLPRAKLVENRFLLAADRAALTSVLFFQCPARKLQEGAARQTPPVGRFILILREVARLLASYRHLNACFRDDAALIYKHIHLGFAIDAGRGLKVLVIRDADRLSFREFETRFNELLVAYATDTLAVVDVSGSTFTVTDLSEQGVLAFTPIINQNQAAILGIGAEASGGEGFLLSCAFDHRINGGKQVAEFLRELSTRLAAHADSFASAAAAAACCSRCLQDVPHLRRLGAFLLPSVEPPGHICSLCLAGI